MGNGIFEVPGGKGKRCPDNSNKVMDLLVGGCQFAANILNVNRTRDTWFNTADFEKNSPKTPNGCNLRTFPTRLADLRADSTNQWNANASKSLHILTGEHPLTMQLRLDVLNVLNLSQMAAPSTDPHFHQPRQDYVTDRCYQPLAAGSGANPVLICEACLS